MSASLAAEEPDSLTFEQLSRVATRMRTTDTVNRAFRRQVSHTNQLATRPSPGSGSKQAGGSRDTWPLSVYVVVVQELRAEAEMRKEENFKRAAKQASAALKLVQGQRNDTTTPIKHISSDQHDSMCLLGLWSVGGQARWTARRRSGRP